MRPRITRPDAVVEAARRCIADKGFLGADVDDIATAAGVSRATVYRYAGGKSALIREVLLLECSELIGRVGDALDEAVDGADALRRMIAVAVASLDRQPVLARAVGADLRVILPALTVDAAALVGRCTALFVPILERAQRRGLVAPEAQQGAVAEEMVRFVLGLIHTPTLAGDGRDPAAAAERAARLFGPALMPRGTYVVNHEGIEPWGDRSFT